MGAGTRSCVFLFMSSGLEKKIEFLVFLMTRQVDDQEIYGEEWSTKIQVTTIIPCLLCNSSLPIRRCHLSVTNLILLFQDAWEWCDCKHWKKISRQFVCRDVWNIEILFSQLCQKIKEPERRRRVACMRCGICIYNRKFSAEAAQLTLQHSSSTEDEVDDMKEILPTLSSQHETKSKGKGNQMSNTQSKAEDGLYFFVCWRFSSLLFSASPPSPILFFRHSATAPTENICESSSDEHSDRANPSTQGIFNIVCVAHFAETWKVCNKTAELPADL